MTLLALLILLLFLAVLVGVAVLLLVLRRRTPGGACARCGYSVKGLTTLTCPECGADLREAGITPVQPRTARLGVGLGAVAALAALGCCACGGLFFANLGVRTATTLRVTPGPPVPTTITTTTSSSNIVPAPSPPAATADSTPAVEEDESSSNPPADATSSPATPPAEPSR